MQEITTYKVGNKSFLSKEEALEYEDTLKKDLKLRARNLFLFWNKMLGYPGIVTATQMVCYRRRNALDKSKCMDACRIIHL